MMLYDIVEEEEGLHGVMSRAQRLSWGWPPLGDSLFSAEFLAAFFCFRVLSTWALQTVCVVENM
jgi:hypothetical protein